MSTVQQVKFRAARGSCGTGTGSGSAVDLTVTDFGEVTAAIVYCTRVVTASPGDAASDGAAVSYGFWDGTNSYAVGTNSDHGAVTANTARGKTESGIAFIPDSTSTVTTPVLKATIAATTDGVTITPTTNGDAVAYRFHAILIKCPNASVDSSTMPSTNGSANGNTVTPGFTADVIFCLGTALTSAGDSVAADSKLSMGITDGTTNACHGAVSFDAETTTLCAANSRTDGCTIDITDGVPLSIGNIDTISGTTFNYYRTEGSTSGQYAYFLSLDLGTANYHLTTALVTSIQNADTTISNGSFVPDFYLGMTSLIDDINFVDTDVVYAVGMDYADADGTKAVQQMLDEDATGTTDSSTVVDEALASFIVYEDDATTNSTWDELTLEANQVRYGYVSDATGEDIRYIAFQVEDVAPADVIKIGSSSVDGGVYLGSTAISKVYDGSTLIWP